MHAPFTVEFCTEEQWGFFSGRFATQAQAIAVAQSGLRRGHYTGAPYVAARVWQAGPSLTGDRMVWDSRD